LQLVPLWHAGRRAEAERWHEGFALVENLNSRRTNDAKRWLVATPGTPSSRSQGHTLFRTRRSRGFKNDSENGQNAWTSTQGKLLKSRTQQGIGESQKSNG